MNNTPKLVASRTLSTTGWQNSTLIEGDVVETLADVDAEVFTDSLKQARDLELSALQS
jgi:hypothetical protein